MITAKMNRVASNAPDTETRITPFLRRRLLMMRSSVRLTFICLATALGSVGAWAQVKAASPLDGVNGKVQSVSSSSIAIQTQTGVVSVEIQQPLKTYRQVPSDLGHVTNDSYVGVPSIEQRNGIEVAQKIMIFPPECVARSKAVSSPARPQVRPLTAE